MKVAHLFNVRAFGIGTGRVLPETRGYDEVIRFVGDTWAGRRLSSEFLRQRAMSPITLEPSPQRPVRPTPQLLVSLGCFGVV